MRKGIAAAAAAALLPLSTSAPSRVSADDDYLEPNVQRIVGVLPPSVCEQLIDLGEKAGFLDEDESIDEDEKKDGRYVPSQTIDVYDWRSDPEDDDEEPYVGSEAIWEALQPWIPKIKQIVKDHRNKEAFAKFYPDEPLKDPDLNWVFFRKYSPNEKRNSLKQHHDTNMNTVNIELSNDYTGGGLFYIKPLVSTGQIASRFEDYGYDWIDGIKRENTSELVFPDLHAGDAIFYNYTVEHAVAPIEAGVRYSMAFFFDMNNPAVKEDHEEEEEDDDEELREGEFVVVIRNDLTDLDLDILLVHDAHEEGKDREKMYTKVRPGDSVSYIALPGDVLQAMVSGTSRVVDQFETHPSELSYAISEIDSQLMDNDAGVETMNDSLRSEL